MRDSILDRYAAISPTESSAEGESDVVDHLGSFGYLRGIRDRAIMLELRHKDGSFVAFPYSYLTRAAFDPSDGIVLQFGSTTVRITGRNLDAEVRPNVRLFAAIARHRVSWIQEADQLTAATDSATGVLIENIKID